MAFMKNAVASLDDSGRLLVPQLLREQAGLTPGMELEIRCRDGRLEIEPTSRKVRIVEKRGVYVAEPEGLVKPLTSDVVREVQEALRDRHLED
jgi:bifunctional DNA-binding transcriptional regulator/antitoxin component of YhaV-PrlF toxin-antitoxin module